MTQILAQHHHSPRARERITRDESHIRSTKDRGYTGQHRTERQRLIPIIRANGATCTMPICIEPTRAMPPGTEPHQWDLNHTNDRTGWTGPAHRSCNRWAPSHPNDIAAALAQQQPTGRWDLTGEGGPKVSTP